MLRGLAARDRLPFDLPSWWPVPLGDAPVFDIAALDEAGRSGWWTPLLLAGLTVLLLAFLWWLAAQFGPAQRRRLPLSRPGLRLRSHALAEAMAIDAGALPTVKGARVRLHGRRTRRLRARITLRLEPEAEADHVLEDFVHGPLDRARSSAGQDQVPAVIRLRAASHRNRRVH